MRIQRSTVFQLVAFGMVLISLLVYWLELWPSAERRLTRALHEQVLKVAQDPAQRLSMAAVTDFPWDQFYVFGPYTPVAVIEASLGGAWPPAQETGIDMNEGSNLLVFRHQGTVVRHLMFPRSSGDFRALSIAGPIAREEASFRVVMVNGVPEVQREPIKASVVAPAEEK